MQAPTGEITRLLGKVRTGDEAARAELMDIVYSALRRLASSMMRRERPGHTLQATELLHETYLRLVGQEVNFENRAHFFAAASTVMRRILVDYARAHRSEKRGGGQVPVALDETVLFSESQSEQMLALEEALQRLARMDARQARIVELRFFGGLTETETADVLKVSARTVKRDWKMAKAWLFAEMNPHSG
jgi:RNA polymerase sigma-70 factor (ECF subfamily)